MPIKGSPKTADPVFMSPPPGGGDHGTLRQAETTARRGLRGRQFITRFQAEHRKRLISFSLIGFGVFAAGLAAQIFFVQIIGAPKVEVYVIQLILSVQVNFLANYRWTWGDRDAPFWRSCRRYNIKRLAGTLLSLALYPILIRSGMSYLAANVLLVAAITPVNYTLGHFWTFAANSQTEVKSAASLTTSKQSGPLKLTGTLLRSGNFE